MADIYGPSSQYSPNNPDYYSALWWENYKALKAGTMSEVEFKQKEIDNHRKAEELRASAGYSGGGDGSQVIVTNENLFQSIVEKVTNRTEGETIGSLEEGTFKSTYAGKAIVDAFNNLKQQTGEVIRTATGGATGQASTYNSGGFGNIGLVVGGVLLALAFAGRGRG